MNEQERIRLAEAMGWRHDTVQSENPRVVWWTNGEISRTALSATVPPFRPFTDANDDYAVLEWMREGLHDGSNPQHWRNFKVALSKVVRRGRTMSDQAAYYVIGDYARAALRVLAQSMRYPDGFKCVHCGYIGDVSEPPHVCEELEQCHTCGGARKYCGCGGPGADQ